MASEALKDLREWQRAQASQQDKALREASRAWTRLGQLEVEQTATREVLAGAVTELEASGIVRDQAAAFLGVSPDELGRALLVPRRRPGAVVGPAERPQSKPGSAA